MDMNANITIRNIPTKIVGKKYRKQYTDNFSSKAFSKDELSEKVANPKHAIINPNKNKEPPMLNKIFFTITKG